MSKEVINSDQDKVTKVSVSSTVSITLPSGMEVEMTLEEAKELYRSLDMALNDTSKQVVPSVWEWPKQKSNSSRIWPYDLWYS